MNGNHRDEIHRINYLTAEMQSLYHLSSLKLGITDSASIVLYSIYDAGNACLLSDIYKNSGVSRQTVNSAIRGLEAQGMLYLEQHSGRAKRVRLTERGVGYAQETVGRLYQAEMDAFDSWTDEEIGCYLGMLEKYLDCFRAQIERL